nr:MAG TPA: hypothetical protein [Bacteriophage sp.]
MVEDLITLRFDTLIDPPFAKGFLWSTSLPFKALLPYFLIISLLALLRATRFLICLLFF